MARSEQAIFTNLKREVETKIALNLYRTKGPLVQRGLAKISDF